MPQLALAGERGDAAVGLDGDPAIELPAARTVQPLGDSCRGETQILGNPRGAETDDERARLREKAAAVHAFTPRA